MHTWFHPYSRIPYLGPEADLILPDTLSSVLPKGLPRDPQDIQTVSTTSWAWDKLRRLLGSDLLYSSALPLPNARWLPITGELLVHRTLTSFNITKSGDLFPNGHFLSLQEEEKFVEASFMDRFVMNRIRSTIRAALPSFPIEPTSFEPLTLLIQNQRGDHLVSKLYHSCSAAIPCTDSKIGQLWEADLDHQITDDQWKWCGSVTNNVSLNARHKLLHFKFLRRMHSTP